MSNILHSVLIDDGLEVFSGHVKEQDSLRLQGLNNLFGLKASIHIHPKQLKNGLRESRLRVELSFNFMFSEYINPIHARKIHLVPERNYLDKNLIDHFGTTSKVFLIAQLMRSLWFNKQRLFVGIGSKKTLDSNL